MYGRKTVFLISTVFMFVSFSLLIMADSMVWLIPAMIFFGIGRAFSSGSLDALFIDQALVRYRETCLAGVIARISILESIGLAIGAIAGGIIANATGTYLANIVLRLVLTAILFILCLFFVREQPLPGKRNHTTLMEHIRQGKQVLTSVHELSFIFIGVYFLGFLLFTIETYWQPAFMQIQILRTVHGC
jgi:MFS family permease